MGAVVKLHKDAEGASNLVAAAGGGNGTSDGIDTRVAKLEVHVDHLVTSVNRITDRIDKLVDTVGMINVELGRINEKLDHKPSKRFIITTVCAVATVSVAILHLLDFFHVRH